MKVYLWFLCLCVTFCVGQKCNNTLSDDEIIIHSSTPCSLDFQITSGYQMEAEIEKLELDSSDNSYLLLKIEHDEKDYKFVWSLKEPKKFIIDQSKVAIEFFTNYTDSQFQIHLKRHGPLTTTTEPTTIMTWPTPVENDTIYYRVNLSVSTEKFTQQELGFKQILVNMTEEYCKKENIELAENVTIKNIDIQTAVQCPITWPDYSSCTQVRYAIPVYLLDSEKYELKVNHLEKMWNSLSGEYLMKSLGWEEYEVPDSSSSLMWWLIVCGGILVLFFVVLFFARMFSVRFGSPINKRRASDKENMIGATPKRVSDASLYPPASQVIPPLFASDTSYVFYEPDSTINNTPGRMRHQHQQINTTRMLADDSSDEEILSVDSKTVRTNFNHTVIQLGHDKDRNRESAL